MNITELHKDFGKVADLDALSNGCHRYKKVQSAIHKLVSGRNCSILDVGCAAGDILKPFTTWHKVSGLDCCDNLLEEAKRNGYCQARVVDVFSERFPFDDSTFDLVFCGETIEHGADTDWLLSEINRVLKPSGNLVLTFPNIRTPISFLAMLLNLPPMFAARYRSGHVRDFTTKEMRGALVDSGFSVKRMTGVDFCVNRNSNGILPFLASHLPSWSSSVVVECRKENPVRETPHEHFIS